MIENKLTGFRSEIRVVEGVLTPNKKGDIRHQSLEVRWNIQVSQLRVDIARNKFHAYGARC